MKSERSVDICCCILNNQGSHYFRYTCTCSDIQRIVTFSITDFTTESSTLKSVNSSLFNCLMLNNNVRSLKKRTQIWDRLIKKTTSSEDKINKCTKCKMYFKYDLYKYHISSNNSHPLINRLPWIIAALRQKYLNCLPQIIAPSQPSSLLLFLLSPPYQVEVGVWSSKTDQWRFKFWRWGYWHCKLIKEQTWNT